ncbi:MAG: hypothetical protein FWG28_02990 [Clostridiales bacterium]|nr:hypothetical protein [Clostridiales bacterium]
MSLFDKIKNQPAGTAAGSPADTGQATNAGAGGGGKAVSVVFADIPDTIAGFTALPQAAMATPFDTAALAVAALCVYSLSKEECEAMLNYLRGPNPMAERERVFLKDRMAQNGKAPFLGASYFGGATPGNDYTPTEPYTVTVSENPYSYEAEGVAKLFVKSGGGDSPRPVSMRLAKDGKWYLWEYSSLLLDIRAPESTNPWA